MSDHAEHSQHAPIDPADAGRTAGHETVHRGHEAPPPAPQEEELPISKVVIVGVVALLVFAVGSAWALKMRSDVLEKLNPTGAENLPASLGAEEQGMVDQIPFELNHWVKDDRAASREQLERYGWVDRKAGTIHIPIERAIELQLADAAKPVPPPAPVPVMPPAPEPTPAPVPMEPSK